MYTSSFLCVSFSAPFFAPILINLCTFFAPQFPNPVYKASACYKVLVWSFYGYPQKFFNTKEADIEAAGEVATRYGQLLDAPVSVVVAEFRL
jgi:hypothetical protein